MTLVTHLVRYFRKPFIINHLDQKWKILDLGCGDLWLTKYLRKLNYNVVGIDKSLDAKYPYTIECDANNLPFDDNSFDCVLMVEVVEHINPKTAYSEIRRVLKPNGKIIVTTPNPKFEWFIELLKKLRIVKYHGSPHINTIYLDELPFELITKFNMFLIDQVGFYVNEK